MTNYFRKVKCTRKISQARYAEYLRRIGNANLCKYPDGFDYADNIAHGLTELGGVRDAVTLDGCLSTDQRDRLLKLIGVKLVIFENALYELTVKGV